MVEVTINNFHQILPQFEQELKKCRFVAVDLEFSCLNATNKLQNSIFDSPQERYKKLKATVEQVIPLQIGVSLFTFDADDNSYLGNTYTFYTFPKSFLLIDTKFTFSSSSIQFLTTHNFDFSKSISCGIPFLNRHQEQLLTNNLKDPMYDDMVFETEALIKTNKEIIALWQQTAKLHDCFILENFSSFENNLSIKYLMHRTLREYFGNIWTYEDEEGFKVKLVESTEYKKLNDELNLEEQYTSILLGFTKIFRLLVANGKPIVGHNLLLDLLMMIDKFENPLPKSYKDFKKLVHSLFPVVFDTKSICFELRHDISESKRFKSTSLEELFNYFRNDVGRHLVPYSPYIQSASTLKQHFHNAGWDSYCTGYILIRMAHIYAIGNDKTRRKFMSSELIRAISKFTNRINVIKGDLSFIQLDGDDPVSKRPPWLIVESIENKPLDINQVSCLLNMHGYVEVKPFSYKGRRAIVAVDNFTRKRNFLSKLPQLNIFVLGEENRTSVAKLKDLCPLKHQLFELVEETKKIKWDIMGLSGTRSSL